MSARSCLAGLAILAWVRHARGDRAGALEAIGEAERVQVSPAVVALFNPVPALRARLLLANGEVGEAGHWVTKRGLAPDDQPGYPREAEYLVLAMREPGCYRLLDWLTGTPGTKLRSEYAPPRGEWVVCGYGRFGGKAGIDSFTELRWVTIATAPGHYPI